MKVTVCQFDNRPEVQEANFQALCHHVSEEKSEFVLVPEMAFYPWLAADKVPSATEWSMAIDAHDKMILRLEELGAKAVMGTRPVLQGGSRRNRAYLWRHNYELVDFHDKWNLPDEEGYWEATWYDRGDKIFTTTRYGDIRIGVSICTEMWFFEHARSYAKQKAHLLCVPRATPHESTDKWLAGGQASAVVSGAYCLSSNLYNPKGLGENLGGLGWIIDPEGNILGTTSAEVPFVTVTIDPEFAEVSKKTYPRDVPG
ncbi:carbon-nitrogen hydrolase family protein [Kiloniella laminariae]|uniref:Carbon-nitrogen hydrolase family protein n=1 Tax=Kiloniella laminariae TaxID=454162 RepID=A0ABT4LE31_9PROT|nr:carbon-nitrogen hydrolase family protein [Kiloniella laminariae]MCZ4279363.1 carbon-nitrogen hydrolase family protein [Kiloniella laminariae]